MLGAIAGDIAGSRFEWNNYKGKDIELYTERCHPTDDSVMTLAIARALIGHEQGEGETAALAVKYMQQLGRRYPGAGYGRHFFGWILTDRPVPYGSFGNGAAMRVSACGWAGRTVEEVIALSRAVTGVTHDHRESFKAAEAVSLAIFFARTGCSKADIETFIRSRYYPKIFTLDDIRPSYTFDVSCRGSVPQAFEAFYESTDFEDALKNAISIGGDSDTIAAITGSIAEAYYGIPASVREKVRAYLDTFELGILDRFEALYGTAKEEPERH